MSDTSKIQWEFPKNSRAYVINAVFVPDPESGGYTAYADNLPGCCTQGDSLDEAIANLKEAFVALVESYRKDGENIPWSHEASGVIRRQLAIHVEDEPS